MSQRLIFRNIAVFLLILLWVYAALSKLLDFDLFKIQMHNQPLPAFVQASLVYLLPPVELITALLLVIPRTQLLALTVSAVLLFFFSGYVALALFKFFSYVPCSCGGILEHMTWQTHFWFNLFFLALSLIATYIIIKERSIPA